MYSKLVRLVEGQKGRQLALVAVVATQEGILKESPTFGSLKKIGATGNQSGFNRCRSAKPFSSEEYEGMKKTLLED